MNKETFSLYFDYKKKIPNYKLKCWYILHVIKSKDEMWRKTEKEAWKSISKKQ